MKMAIMPWIKGNCYRIKHRKMRELYFVNQDSFFPHGVLPKANTIYRSNTLILWIPVDARKHLPI